MKSTNVGHSRGFSWPNRKWRSYLKFWYIEEPLTIAVDSAQKFEELPQEVSCWVSETLYQTLFSILQPYSGLHTKSP